MLDNLKKIVIEKPVDKIISQIRFLITSGELKSGDKLPPERKLSEKLGVSRNTVREAIRKLEFYGILKTHPQSGTVVSGMGIVALEGLISDIIQLEEHDFKSLVETRVLLEKHSAYLAAEKRTDEDIMHLTNALHAHRIKVEKGLPAIEEDLLFHIKLAECSKNGVLKSLMMIITPDIVNSFNEYRVCDDDSIYKSIKDHDTILQHIIDQDSKNAAKAMQDHLEDVLNFSKNMEIIY